MRLTDRIRHASDPVSVFRMLTDPRFQESKCALSGAVRHAVDVRRHEDGGARIVTTRELPTTGMPDFVRSMTGETITVVETSEWGAGNPDGTRAGTLTVEITGAPVRLTGTLVLSPEGSDTVQVFEGELKASVPFVGGRVERAAEPAIRAAITVEQRAGEAWLAGA